MRKKKTCENIAKKNRVLENIKNSIKSLAFKHLLLYSIF